MLLCGCPDPDTDPPADAGPDGHVTCPFPYLGDPSKPVVVTPLVLGADGTSEELVDGGDVPLIFPPQGGRVAFLGARAQNLDPCAIRISGTMRDTQTKQVTFDVRTINLRPAADGWGESVDADYNSFSNIPVCPNNWASKNAYDESFELELTVTDRKKRSGTVKVSGIPRCAEPDKEVACKCICKVDYVTGEPCGDPDAGVDGGGGGGS